MTDSTSHSDVSSSLTQEVPKRQSTISETASPLPSIPFAKPPPVPLAVKSAGSVAACRDAGAAATAVASSSAAGGERGIRGDSNTTPPPSPPLRRTKAHLPEKRMGSSSSIEFDPSIVSPVSPITSPDHGLLKNDNIVKGTPPATPERVRKSVVVNKQDPEVSTKTTTKKPRGSVSSQASTATTSTTNNRNELYPNRTSDLPIPISPSDPHHDHDLPIPTPVPGEEKIPLHPAARTRSNTTSSISSASSLNEKRHISIGTATSAAPVPPPHKHPLPSSSEAGYKGRLWSDWHWHRNQDLPVTPKHQPGVTEAELEKKKYVSPYPTGQAAANDNDAGSAANGKNWKQELEQAAGWAKEKFGEFGKKLNENMHYGGDSGRGRRTREGNVSFK